MKKLITAIFVALGVIFFILIALGVYLFVADPLNLKPLLFGTGSARTGQTNTVSDGATTTQSGTASLLTDTQKKALEAFGIDPATIPSSLTPTQIACFEAILGVTRVAEIKGGAAPTALEFFKAKSCI